MNTPRGKRETKYKGAEQEGLAKVTPLTPLNDNQALYIEALAHDNQVIVLGPSGTGKTFVATTVAANLYLSRKINQIIFTRPAVSVGKSLGALPGDLDEKFAPWMTPVLDTLRSQLGQNKLETDMKKGNIRMAPLEYMRGSSFDNAFILADEAQNLTIDQFKMLVTRVGENSTIVLNGDIRQSDLKEQSGLSKALHLAKKYSIPATIVEFTVDDIVRSDICKQWVTAFYEEGL